jgi:hypothetical protein
VAAAFTFLRVSWLVLVVACLPVAISLCLRLGRGRNQMMLLCTRASAVWLAIHLALSPFLDTFREHFLRFVQLAAR